LRKVTLPPDKSGSGTGMGGRGPSLGSTGMIRTREKKTKKTPAFMRDWHEPHREKDERREIVREKEGKKAKEKVKAMYSKGKQNTTPPPPYCVFDRRTTKPI